MVSSAYILFQKKLLILIPNISSSTSPSIPSCKSSAHSTSVCHPQPADPLPIKSLRGWAHIITLRSENVVHLEHGIQRQTGNNSSCWRTWMKTMLLICYIYVWGLGPVHVLPLVGGSLLQTPRIQDNKNCWSSSGIFVLVRSLNHSTIFTIRLPKLYLMFGLSLLLFPLVDRWSPSEDSYS